MPYTKLFPITMLVVFMPMWLFSQKTAEAKWRKHIDYITARYSKLPAERLDTITAYLDSTVIGTHCYRFITNADNTKCIAFFLTDMNSPSYESIKQEYGGTHHIYTWDDKKDNQITAFAYTVSGMYYQGKWYYVAGTYVRFYATDIAKAQNIFLIRTLMDNGYFKKNKPEGKGDFWNRNEFAKNTYPYKEEFPDIPEVVCRASLAKKSRDMHNKNKSIESIAIQMSTHLWDSLHQVNAGRYNYRLGQPLSLYNADRNIILLPILYNDQEDKSYLIYFVMKINPGDTSVNTWRKFPEKIINREKGKEALEVIYDIRTFINNWGWGTVNMISQNDFWENNFKVED